LSVPQVWQYMTHEGEETSLNELSGMYENIRFAE
jgi:hypothetical protein